jgi:hypothetical protein
MPETMNSADLMHLIYFCLLNALRFFSCFILQKTAFHCMMNQNN